MWFRTKDGWYIKGLHGANYVSWVGEKDKEYAATFSGTEAQIAEWLKIITELSGKELEAVTPFV